LGRSTSITSSPLACRTAARAGTGGEDHRVRSVAKAGHLVEGGVFQVADHSVGPGCPHVFDMVGIPHDAQDRVPGRAQQALKPQRDRHGQRRSRAPRQSHAVPGLSGTGNVFRANVCATSVPDGPC
jgi:hypothetical protein